MRKVMRKMAAMAMLSVLSLAVDATPTQTFDATPRAVFTPVVQENQTVSAAYYESMGNMPIYLQRIGPGAAVKMRITIPPGVRFAGIRAESGLWGDSRVGVVPHDGPYCAIPGLNSTCEEPGVPVSPVYVYASDLNIAGRFGEVFPTGNDKDNGIFIVPSERTVYGWVVNLSSYTVSLGTMTINYTIGDIRAYNAWVGGTAGLAISPTSASGQPGGSVDFTLTGTTSATITSSDTKVVTCPPSVNASPATFRCSFLAAGTSIITATALNGVVTATVTVGSAPPPPPPPSLDFLTPTATSGIRVNGGTIYRQFATVSANDNISVQFSFMPPAADVGKTVNLFNVISYNNPLTNQMELFAVVNRGNYPDYVSWDTVSMQLETIPAYKTETLRANTPVTMTTYAGGGLDGLSLLVTNYAGYTYRDAATGLYYYRIFAAPLMVDFQ